MHKTDGTPVILSDGSGTRLWPLSLKAMLKQLLVLAGQQTTIQERSRARGASGLARQWLSATRSIASIAEQLRAAITGGACIVLEPRVRNTAAAATLPVLGDDPNSLILLMPLDHVVVDGVAFPRRDVRARGG